MENTELKVKPINATGIMQEEQADSPCKKIYFVVQLMYISDEPHKLHELFFNLVRDVQKAAPTTSLFIANICKSIMNDDYLGALEETRNLIGYEQKIIARA
jgi:flagellar protein FlbT